MKALLVLQEGPGAGRTYPLDPFKQPTLTVGRSAECDIALQDGRASRRHAEIRWDGRQWLVVDRNSTNGTYVNGLRVTRPYDLRWGDRLTIGETTMVLREPGSAAADVQSPAIAGPSRAGQSYPPPTGEPERTAEMQALRMPAAAQQPGPVVRPPGAVAVQPAAMRAAKRPASTASTIAYWSVQGLVAVAVVFLAAGAFLPWIRVTGSLSQELGPVLQNLTDVASWVLGTDSFFRYTQDIGGLEGYGKITLAIAALSLIALLADIFYRRSAVPGVLYLLSGLIVTGAMAFELASFSKLAERAAPLTLLFGVQLRQIVKVFDRFIDVQVALLPGIVLTMMGLALLMVGGAGRLLVAILDRNR